MNEWDDQEDFTPADWQGAVEAGDTRLGYVAWVQQQRDERDDDPLDNEPDDMSGPGNPSGDGR